MKRKIVQISREKCIGCEKCVHACHEMAIEMIGGKAMLIKDDYCDGLGDCLPACPADAIQIIEREAAEYDHNAVMQRIEAAKEKTEHTPVPSHLYNWPVQLQLAPVQSVIYAHKKLLIAADCSAFTYGDFHQKFIKDHTVLIGCPKLDPVRYAEKLQAIFTLNPIESIDVVIMEVPCCSGLKNAVITALNNSHKSIPMNIHIISTKGELLS
ncbi:MAG: 4Fe-4S binding protein [Erysipelotrichaceae bacterium]|nr:4Fe-4S binding protein [Erysipelotrichaceae bacterium]